MGVLATVRPAPLRKGATHHPCKRARNPTQRRSLERGQGAVVGAGHGQARAAGAAAHQRPQQGDAKGGAFSGVGA